MYVTIEKIKKAENKKHKKIFKNIIKKPLQVYNTML